MDIGLVPVSDVIINIQQEHQGEEEAETSNEVPHIMGVKVVQMRVAVFVLHPRPVGQNRSVFHGCDEMIKGGHCAQNSEQHKNPAGVGRPLANIELHKYVELKVEEKVGKENG